MLQYPTKKLNLNSNDAVVIRTSVKPVNQEVQIEYKLDTASRHYDAFKGEQLAITSDGKVNNYFVDPLQFNQYFCFGLNRDNYKLNKYPFHLCISRTIAVIKRLSVVAQWIVKYSLAEKQLRIPIDISSAI